MCWANERARDGCRKNEQQQQRQQRWQQQNTRRRGDVNIRCTSAFHREINALSTCNTSAVCGLAFVWPCSHSPSLSLIHTCSLVVGCTACVQCFVRIWRLLWYFIKVQDMNEHERVYVNDWRHLFAGWQMPLLPLMCACPSTKSKDSRECYY